MKSQSSIKPYITLLIALSISYIVMFAIMFSRVNEWSNLFLSLNQVYMAGIMISAMLIIMLVTMGSMFENKKLNIVLLGLGTALILLFWTLVRTQAGVGNGVVQSRVTFWREINQFSRTNVLNYCSKIRK
jgi:ABC-type multidrug transport system permease subunit